MGSNCSSTLKKKDKEKSSSKNDEHRRTSNFSVESVAYGDKNEVKKSSEIDVNNQKDALKNNLSNEETKTAVNHKIVSNQVSNNLSLNSSLNTKLNNLDTQDNQKKDLSNSTSLTSSGNDINPQHSSACFTYSNPNDSINRPIRDCFDAIFTIKNKKSFVVLISNDRNELCVYNLKTNKYARTLRNVNRPKNVQFINEYEAVILCNRELNVLNLDEGKLITKLKGVMNQKMPFYGLHNENYAVALSRNRMYVNMINLETGNIDTTFKVGEDRFLNSLLVSQNGKICVCGDETQKPFPLLVWDLTSRKLIYDLRIPNHEFITNLSAISNDGHFVVSVCKETTSNGINFIVVYDLQSGTLFKKLKPDFNTVSVTISSKDNCVINGLENKQIQVWDLSTGAIRHILEEHEFSVDTLIVADEGEYVLSYDSTQQDKAIRVWSLNSGTCIKSYIPDYSISCCKLSSSGNSLIICPDDSMSVNLIKLFDSDDVDEEYGDSSRNELEFDLGS